MDLPKLISLVMRSELTLARMDLLPDRFEGYMGKRFREIMAEWAGKELFKDEGPKQESQTLEPKGKSREQAIADFAEMHLVNAKWFREIAYVSCWRSGNTESEAMWRIYCPVGGVAVVLPYERLRDSLNDKSLLIGIVQYLNLDEQIIDWGNAYNALICKRREFEHEHEVRIVKLAHEFSEGHKEGEKSYWRAAPHRPTYLPLEWAPEDCIERIVMSPYAPPWHLDLLSSMLGKLSPALVGRLVPSGMGGEPAW